jgi:hypothetical protein
MMEQHIFFFSGLIYCRRAKKRILLPTIKAVVSRNENFKIQITNLCISADGLNNIWLPFCAKIKTKIYVDAMKSLTTSKKPSSNLAQEACSCI